MFRYHYYLVIAAFKPFLFHRPQCESTNTLNIRTMTDSQSESTERLYEAANRIDNIITELGSNANIIEDKETSQ
jgi:hypothetical protein